MNGCVAYQCMAAARSLLIVGAVFAIYQAGVWLLDAAWLLDSDSIFSPDYWVGFAVGIWAVHAGNRERFEV